MNRNHLSALAAGLIALWLGAAAMAADAPTSRPASRPGMGRMDPKALMDRVMSELNLTADQQEKVRQIAETQRQALEAWMKEHGQELRDLQGKLQEALKDPKGDKAQGIREQLDKLQASRKPLHDELLKKLSEVLTSDQMAKAKEILTPRPGMMPGGPGGPGGEGPLAQIRALKLDDKQQAQVKEIADAAMAEAQKATDVGAKGKIWHDAFDKIRDTVLTDQQRKLLQEMRGKNDPLADLQKLNLTEDQRTKIQDIVQQSRKDAEKADSTEAKTQIFQAAHKKIMDEVLTADQKKQLADWKAHTASQPAREGLRERIRERVGAHREGGSEPAK